MDADISYQSSLNQKQSRVNGGKINIWSHRVKYVFVYLFLNNALKVRVS